MREIKFRAWDKEYNFMIVPDGIVPTNYEIITGEGKVMEYEENHSYVGTSTEWEDISDKRILMQYTGLKDKNGVEIYEGDVIRNTKHNQILKVVWQDPKETTSGDGVRWLIEKPGFRFEKVDNKMLYVFTSSTIEVIGNIYENPELLSKEAG